MLLFSELSSETAPHIVPITVEQLRQMIQIGIVHDGDPIELIDGLLVRKDRSAGGGNIVTHDPRHALLIKRLQRILTKPCESAGCHLQIQLPIKLNEINAPEPDMAIIRGTEEDYTDRHPGPSDLLVVIEVSHSSLRWDRTTKQRLYAVSAVPEYWVANLPESQIEVYKHPDPASGTYAQMTVYTLGQTLTFQISPNHHLEIGIADLFR